jgi:hypothetical protein
MAAPPGQTYPGSRSAPASGNAQLGGQPMPAQQRDVPGRGASDPARWYKADATPAQRLATSQKEASAAYAQALQECKSMKGTERSRCQTDAKTNYNNDLAAAKQEYAGSRKK